MTEPEKDQVTSSTPQDMAADVAATASADDARAAEVVADAEVIEANEAGELDAELEQAAAKRWPSAIEESESWRRQGRGRRLAGQVRAPARPSGIPTAGA